MVGSTHPYHALAAPPTTTFHHQHDRPKQPNTQVGDERYNVFTGCPHAQTATIVLRGGSEQFIEESHRSIHDALMVVKRCVQSKGIVAGGGAVEMEVGVGRVLGGGGRRWG